MKKILTILTLVLTTGVMSAQAQKIGHVDMDTIQRTLPSMQKAMMNLQEWEKEQTDKIAALEMELQKKSVEFDSLQRAGKSQIILESRQHDLQVLGERYQLARAYYQQNAQVQQQKELAPIQQRLMKVIESEAAKAGLDYVIDKQVTYYAKGKDITPAVLNTMMQQPEEK